jgi:bacterioferritin-associated ferredoxin
MRQKHNRQEHSMAVVYIFAEHIRDLVLAGKTVITVPEDARISAAAWDLIKDKQVEVKYAAPEPDPVPEEPPADEKKAAAVQSGPSESSASEKPSKRDVPDGTIADIRAQVAKAISEIDEADIEIIIEKVLARLEQVRGEPAQDTPRQAIEDTADDDLVICRCEEITRGEIKEAIRNGMTTLSGIKRVTRAGMGLCQGQTCQELVTRLLAEELGVKPHEVEPMTARGPVRPLRMDVFANS